jgi:hypothetical protein
MVKGKENVNHILGNGRPVACGPAVAQPWSKWCISKYHIKHLGVDFMMQNQIWSLQN